MSLSENRYPLFRDMRRRSRHPAGSEAPMSASARSLVAAAAAAVLMQGAAWAPAQAQTREIPKFEADASWAKLPDKWVWGQVSSVSIDENGHAWVLQRPSTVRADQKAKAAPPVLEFD